MGDESKSLGLHEELLREYSMAWRFYWEFSGPGMDGGDEQSSAYANRGLFIYARTLAGQPLMGGLEWITFICMIMEWNGG